MYCGTCLRSRFQKTFSEGLVSVVSFDYATRDVSIELEPVNEIFEVWTCVRCGRPINLKLMQKTLDCKVEHWLSEKDLCIV